MHTVLTTNNAYDTVLLTDDEYHVLSAWTADPETIASFARDSARPDDWQRGEWPRGFDPDQDGDETLRTVAAYGVIAGLDGRITDESRKTFWARALDILED